MRTLFARAGGRAGSSSSRPPEDRGGERTHGALLPDEVVIPILLTALACVLAWALVAVFTPALQHILKYHAVALVVIGVSLELARRGFTRAAAAVFTLSIWALTQLPPFSAGHLGVPGIVLPIISVLAAGLLWSSTGAMGLAVLSSLIWLTALWALPRGLLPPIQDRTEFQFWLLLTEALFVTSVFVYVVTGAIRRHTDATRLAEDRARRLVELAPDAMLTVDGEGVIRSANPASQMISGIAPGELVGRRLLDADLVPEEVRDRARASFQQAPRGENIGPFEGEVIRPDGSRVPVEALATWLGETPEEGMEVVVRDITVRKRDDAVREAMAEQLRMAQQMETVAQLAGGVAHDFNNLLTVVGGCAELIDEEPGTTQTVRELTGEIQAAQRQAADLTRHLLAFAQKQVVEPRPISLADEVSARESLIRRLAGDDVDLQTRLPDDDTTVVVDPHQVEQVLASLVSNARDAQNAAGTILISLECRTSATPVEGPTGTSAPGAYVVLSVTDWGQGIPHHLQGRIWDPFFTTKEVGEGTGLGLSAVLGIVRQSDGQVRVQSEPGEGTTVEVWFPRAGRSAEAPAPTRS